LQKNNDYKQHLLIYASIFHIFFGREWGGHFFYYFLILPFDLFGVKVSEFVQNFFEAAQLLHHLIQQGIISGSPFFGRLTNFLLDLLHQQGQVCILLNAFA